MKLFLISAIWFLATLILGLFEYDFVNALWLEFYLLKLVILVLGIVPLTAVMRKIRKGNEKSISKLSLVILIVGLSHSILIPWQNVSSELRNPAREEISIGTQGDQAFPEL